jgi:hypothetical protein
MGKDDYPDDWARKIDQDYEAWARDHPGTALRAGHWQQSILDHWAQTGTPPVLFGVTPPDHIRPFPGETFQDWDARISRMFP